MTLVITLKNGDEIRRNDVETFNVNGTVCVIYIRGEYASQTFTNVFSVGGSVSVKE